MRAKGELGDVVLGLLVLLPLTPYLFLKTTNAHVALTQSPLFVFILGALVLLAGFIWRTDRWMGLFLCWNVLSLIWNENGATSEHSASAFETVELMSLGALAILAIRQLSEARKHAAYYVLIGVGVFQVLYGILQMSHYDPLRYGAMPIMPIGVPVGTLTNSGYLAFYLAVLVPAVPLWASLTFLGAIIGTRNNLGVLAALSGLAWVHRANRTAVVGLVIALVALGVLLSAVHVGGWLGGGRERVTMWTYALESMTLSTWLIGNGPGSWAVEIPAIQVARNFTHPGVFFHAHNEWLQALREVGLMGVVLMGGWLWSQRTMFYGRYGGSCVAILIGSFGFFGFRLATVGILLITVIGLALPPLAAP